MTFDRRDRSPALATMSDSDARVSRMYEFISDKLGLISHHLLDFDFSLPYPSFSNFKLIGFFQQGKLHSPETVQHTIKSSNGKSKPSGQMTFDLVNVSLSSVSVHPQN